MTVTTDPGFANTVKTRDTLRLFHQVILVLHFTSPYMEPFHIIQLCMEFLKFGIEL